MRDIAAVAYNLVDLNEDDLIVRLGALSQSIEVDLIDSVDGSETILTQSRAFDEIRKAGIDILNAASSQAHDILCAPVDGNGDLASALDELMNEKTADATAKMTGLLAPVLVGSLGLPQSIAVLVGSLIVKRMAKGTSDFVCENWKASLNFEDNRMLPPDGINIATQRGFRCTAWSGLKLITLFEGCELTAYQDAVGVWTIGYGHTVDVHQGMTINQTQADRLLQEDLSRFEAAVEEAVTVGLNENQFGALVSFTFNLGSGSLSESTLLHLLNAGDLRGAANEFPRWNKAGGQPLLGLTRRRLAERALFLSQPWEPFQDYDLLKLTTPSMRGSFVRYVQKLLTDTGYDVEVNGTFDKATEKLVRQFQEKRHLTVDGIIGIETIKALC